MFSGILKCSLAVLLTCAFFVSSGSSSANAHAGTVTSAGTDVSALSGASAFTGTAHFPNTHERHKGIRSYDNTNFPQDNDANRGVKSLDHYHRTKNDSQNYSKDGDGCSKCKWENDDYWERDESEEKGDENNGDECDDGDDGQYKPDKTHHHGGSISREHASELHLSGVHKTGPTSIYDDNVKEGVKRVKPDNLFGVTNFSENIGYAGLTNSYGSTPTPGPIWNIPFASTSKSGYSGVTVNAFVTRSSYGSAGGNRHGDTFAGDFGTTPSSTWKTGLGSNPTVAGFPSSQKSGLSWNINQDNTPARSYGSTSKPETSWNIGIGAPISGFSASQKSGTSWNNGHDDIPIGNYKTTPRPGQGWNTRFPDIPTTRFPFLQKPASDWNPNHGNIPAESFGTKSKPGSSWNTNPGAPTEGSSSSQKPEPSWNAGHYNIPAQSFGTTSKPGSNWNIESGVPTAEFSPSQKPLIPWSIRRHGMSTGNSASTVNLGRNQNTGFDGKSELSSNQGTMLVRTFGCTRPDTSCSEGNRGPVKVGATPFDTGLVRNDKSPSSISSTTSHGRSDTISPGAHSNIFSPGKLSESPTEDSIHRHSGVFKPSYGIETTTTISLSSVGTGSSVWSANIPPVHAGSSSYSSAKNSFGNTRPTYETDPLGTQLDGQIVTRPGNQSGDGNAPWFSKQPESTITPGDYSRSGVGIWTSRKPGNRNVTAFSKHPEDRNVSPIQQTGGGSETWPSRQVGHESRLRCSSISCESSTDPFSGSSSCEGNFNCDGGCSEKGNKAPTIHGPCGGVLSGPSAVNKTYYPAGTGDGNVPNIANTYEPGLFSNTGNGAYPGVNIKCGRKDNSCNQGNAGVTLKDSVQWNSANPFLYRPVGSIPYDTSHSLSETTTKPIGKGNPFLDFSWNNPNADNNNANNDRNVIRLRQENSNLFNKGNPFLTDNKRRGDIEINTDEQVIPFEVRNPERNNLFGVPFGSGSSGSSSSSYDKHPAESPGSGLPGTSGYGNIKSGLHPGRIFPQGRDSDTPSTGDDSQNTGSLQCKFGLFGCGTPGSGSYAVTKGNVNSDPGEFGSARTGIASASGNNRGRFGTGADYSGSVGNNLAGTIGGAHAGAYAASFSSAQASSSSFANTKSLSFSDTGGHGNNFGQANSGSWSFSGAQNQGEPNSQVSNGASVFASSGARSWSGNHPVDVKG